MHLILQINILNSPQLGRRDIRNHFHRFMVLTRHCLFNQLLFNWYLISLVFSSKCFNIFTIFNINIVLTLISIYLIIPFRYVIFFILIIMINNLRGRYFSYVFWFKISIFIVFFYFSFSFVLYSLFWVVNLSS